MFEVAPPVPVGLGSEAQQARIGGGLHAEQILLQARLNRATLPGGEVSSGKDMLRKLGIKSDISRRDDCYLRA